MEFPWTPKKDPRKDDLSATGQPAADDAPGAAAESADRLGSTDQFERLERMLHDAREQVARLRSDRSAADAVNEKLDLLLGKLDAAVQGASQKAGAAGSDTLILPLFEGIARKLDELDQAIRRVPTTAAPAGPAAPPPEALGEPIRQLQASLARQEETFGAALHHIYARMEAGFSEVGQLLQPPAPPAEETPELPAGIADWQRVILGEELCGNPALSGDCLQLITGVLHGQYEARALAGQLLVFQSAATEKMPTLLKDIGEAYYRWQPKTRPGTGKFEGALVDWLQRTCDSAGIPNTIEIVNPGERFDTGRHNSNGRGVEVTQTLGWVVLRDNGKVYTKALVEVR